MTAYVPGTCAEAFISNLTSKGTRAPAMNRDWTGPTLTQVKAARDP